MMTRAILMCTVLAYLVLLQAQTAMPAAVVTAKVAPTTATAVVPEWTDTRPHEELVVLADKGDGRAMTVLGWRYYNGAGVDANRETARQWWFLAAACGDSRARMRLGCANPFVIVLIKQYALGRNTNGSLLMEAATANDTLAQAALGCDYLYGSSARRNSEMALRWLHRAAEKGSVLAAAELAVTYTYGHGVPIQEDKAALWAQKAVTYAKGNLGAMECEDINALARLHSQGAGMDRNLDKALEYAKLAAKRGDIISHLMCGALYEELGRDAEAVVEYQYAAARGEGESTKRMALRYAKGKGVRQDVSEARRLFTAMAEYGDAEAALTLAMAYSKGEFGCVPDEELSLSWARRAADKGEPRAIMSLIDYYVKINDIGAARKMLITAAQSDNIYAMNVLGNMYMKGIGSPADAGEAARWYMEAAAWGNASAMYNLGVLYKMGQGVRKDAAEAVKWFTASGKLGETDAMTALGYCYETGEGISLDLQQARHWYNKAAQADSADSMYKLADMYAEGRGGDKDDAKAVEWLEKAAGQGHPLALYKLALRYAEGRGVAVDLTKAKSFMQRSAEKGNEQAKTWLREYEAKQPKGKSS